MTQRFRVDERQYQGCLLGAAIGDRLASNLVGNSRKILWKHGSVSPLSSIATSDSMLVEYSENIHSLLAVASSFADCHGFAADDFTARLIDVHRRCGPQLKRTGDPATASALDALSHGTPWRQAGIIGAVGAGALLRVIPISLLFGLNQQVGKLSLRVTIDVVTITHRDPRVVIAAAAVVAAIAQACVSESPINRAEFVDRVARFASFTETVFSREFTDFEPLFSYTKLLHQVCALIDSSDSNSPNMLGPIGSALRTTAAALLAFVQSPDDFVRTIEKALCSPDCSKVSVGLAGSMAGVFNGIDAIPTPWLNALPNRRTIAELANRLHAARY